MWFNNDFNSDEMAKVNAELRAALLALTGESTDEFEGLE